MGANSLPRLICRTLGLLVGLSIASATSSASAETGGVTILPSGKVNTTGVRLTVDSRWIDAVGYRPVRVEILPLKTPVKEDRQFRVVLRPFGNKDQISQIIELKEGSLQATATILVPQDSYWHELAIDVFEEGRILDELSSERHTYGNNWDWNESIPGMLLIDADLPARDQLARDLFEAERGGSTATDPFAGKSFADVRNLAWMFRPDFNNNGKIYQVSESGTPLEILKEIKKASKADILSPAELPERWLDLTAFDLIIISQADLLALAKQEPQKLQAIADWTRAGRTLIVYESGAGFTGLAALEKSLQLTPRPNADAAPYRGWRVPNSKQHGQGLQNYNPNRYGIGVYPGQPTVSGDESKPADTAPTVPGDAFQEWGFVIRPAGLGQVVAFEKDPFPGEKENWEWLLNSLRGSSWNPLYRTGATMQQRNEDFWNFLIAGTGQAPVFSFVILISLFVMLIGPVNYYYLQRRQRLYLLLVTVPAGALVVTLGLFGYALIVDGLGVKSRVRSITNIDQRAGQGASTSRQGYYASLAPSQGFGFEDDTQILPYLHRPTHRHRERVIRRNVLWSDDDQQLRGGYISSRTLSQLLVTKAAPTKARLLVGKVTGDKLPMTNELQANLAWLLVMTEGGNYFAGKDIAPGPVELTTITSKEAADELKKRLRAFQPAFPAGYSEAMHDTPLEWFEGGPYRYRDPSPADQATSLLERSIARYSYLSSQPLEPRTYVAIAANSPLVPLGTPSRQYDSLHVIEGSY